MKHVLLAVVVFVFAAPAVAADYVFILSARGNPFWQAVEQGVREKSAELGIEPVIYMMTDDRAIEEQLNTCLNVITLQPKIIVMSSLSANVGVQCFMQAQKKGIVVGDVDANLSVEAAKEEGVDLAFSVGSDNYLVGNNAGDYLADEMKGKAPKILILEGPPSSNNGTKRVAGFKDRLEEKLPEAKVEASISGNWDQLKAMTITTDVLQRVPDIDVVYAANDMMALGAMEAIKSAGRTGEIIIIGVDGVGAARDAVLAGTMSATVAQLPYLMGARSVELAVDAVAGKAKGHTEVTPTPVLTTDMLKANTDPVLKYVR